MSIITSILLVFIFIGLWILDSAIARVETQLMSLNNRLSRIETLLEKYK
ncbi:hypothetical protein [Salmonella phage PS3-1]|nr:hypothetical protein [Salmonella phage PS3-1]